MRNNQKQQKPASKPATRWDVELAEAFGCSQATVELSGGYKATVIDVGIEQLVAMRDAACDQGYDGSDTDWSGSWKMMRNALLTGSGATDIAYRIEKQLAKLDVGITTAPRWHNDLAGYYPMVSAAVAGDPFSMRNRSQQASPNGALRVFLPANCSCTVENREFTDIVIEVVAALRALSAVRPVELIVFGSIEATVDGAQSQAAFFRVPVGIQYGDARALATWCDIALGRAVFLSIVTKHKGGFNGGWPWYQSPTSREVLQRFRDALGCTEEDVLIPPLHKNVKQAQEEVRAALRKRMDECGVSINVANVDG